MLLIAANNLATTQKMARVLLDTLGRLERRQFWCFCDRDAEPLLFCGRVAEPSFGRGATIATSKGIIK
jgi:hypothetical protein